MKIAVISDIHGNMEAFLQVLRDIDHCHVDAVVCLGDCIGYGPEPEQVVRLVRRLNIPCVMGNHELGLADPAYLNWFNPPTRRSLLITRKLLSLDTLDYIKGLKAAMVLHGCLCVHGCPPESITTYLFELNEAELLALFGGIREKICFVGHTHILEIIGFDGRYVYRTPLGRGPVALEEQQHYIVNVGSVDQPRDGNNNAKYVIWDSSVQSIEVRFVPYNIAVTARKIREIGFPEINASRLW